MFRPKEIATHGDGWRTPADGTYLREDGTEFQVPVKKYRSIVTGQVTSSYGSYTQKELEAFSDADLRKKGR